MMIRSATMLLIAISVASLIAFGSRCEAQEKPLQQNTQSDAGSPTFEQTAAFILLAGNVEISQIKQTSDKAVSFNNNNASDNPIIGLLAPQLSQGTLTTIDRAKCAVQLAIIPVGGEYYFNNIILDDIKADEIVYPDALVRITFRGEDNVHCLFNDPVKGKLCEQKMVITTRQDNFERFIKAVKYLYSNYCTAAKRKSPF